MKDPVAALAAIASEARRGEPTSALLTGAAGTAGLMAAETVAASLGRAVYRVDLAALIGEYSDETEKTLAALLSEAERADAVLFVDEADVLFGKRTGVKDSHDRYANLDTTALLERIEAYRGVALLATNLRTNVDAAYTRKLRRVVDYTPK